MKLIEKTEQNVVIELEYLERLYIKMALSFFIGPYTGGISDKERRDTFLDSRSPEVLKELLDPGWQERIAKYKKEREEAKVRGKKWQRTGSRWSKKPFLVKLTYQDLLSIELLALVIPNNLFDYHMDPGSIENVKEVRKSVVRILNEVNEE